MQLNPWIPENVLTKNGLSITSLDDWKRVAGPKRDYQWQDNFSAKEAARAWLAAAPCLPVEIESILVLHSDFTAPLCWNAEPEVRIKFDAFAGEPRNTDLLVSATDSRGRYTIAVEAKALESFGRTIAAERKTASDAALRNRGSNRLRRIEQLVSAVLAPGPDEVTLFDSLRYQLLTATAGALRAAIDQDCSRAVLLIQEFIPVGKRTTGLARNTSDLDEFVQRLTRRAISKITVGNLEGPIRLPTNELFRPTPDLYIGKVRSLVPMPCY
jgi:hypothetical protein